MILKEFPEIPLIFASLIQWNNTNPDVIKEEIIRISLSISMNCNHLMIELHENQISDRIISIQFQISHFIWFMSIDSLQYWRDVYEMKKLYNLYMNEHCWLIEKCNDKDSICIKIKRSLTNSDIKIHIKWKTGLQITEFYPNSWYILKRSVIIYK